jgi:hypothetical protein
MRPAPDEWLPIPQAFLSLRDYFRAEATFRYHLNRRAINGLAAADAVRLSPLGHLRVNPSRVEAWALGEPERPPRQMPDRPAA